MPFADVSSGRLFYEIEGDPTHPPLVLIAGQGAQLISWPLPLRDRLIAEGFHLILFDNRDAGLSDVAASADYELGDMAQDTAELLDALDIERAHVVGQSMGGMIAQELVLAHPRKVLSLCLIYSASSPSFITRDPEVWAIRGEDPAGDRDSAVEQYIRHELIAGLEEYSEDWIRSYAERTIDRAYRPDGGARQLAAVRKRVDRTEALAAVSTPTVVMHGREDRLVHYRAGLAIASAIQGSELHLYAGMGHQLLPSLSQEYARVIARNCDRASQIEPTTHP